MTDPAGPGVRSNKLRAEQIYPGEPDTGSVNNLEGNNLGTGCPFPTCWFTLALARAWKHAPWRAWVKIVRQPRRDSVSQLSLVTGRAAAGRAVNLAPGFP